MKAIRSAALMACAAAALTLTAPGAQAQDGGDPRIQSQFGQAYGRDAYGVDLRGPYYGAERNAFFEPGGQLRQRYDVPSGLGADMTDMAYVPFGVGPARLPGTRYAGMPDPYAGLAPEARRAQGLPRDVFALAPYGPAAGPAESPWLGENFVRMAPPYGRLAAGQGSPMLSAQEYRTWYEWQQGQADRDYLMWRDRQLAAMDRWYDRLRREQAAAFDRQYAGWRAAQFAGAGPGGAPAGAITADERAWIRALLRQEGYSDVGPLSRTGGGYRAIASRNGEDLIVAIDASTGAITARPAG